jgi:hypothetical protein
MEGRFQRTDEAFRDYTKMKSLRYDGDIEVYLSSMEAYNVRANVSGVALKSQIRQGLPEAILENMARDTRPNMPDVDYIELVRRCGQQYEYRKEQKKEDQVHARPGPSSHKPSTEAKRPSGPGKKSRKGKEKAANPPSEQPAAASSAAGSSKYPVIHHDKEVALRGVSKKIRAERKEKRQCQRCGRWKHSWPTCTHDISVSGSKVAATPAPGKKRSAPDGDASGPSSGGKKQKKASTPAAAAASSSAPNALQRLGQVFAEEEELLDYEVKPPTLA